MWRWSCPRCGFPVHRRERVRLAFDGSPLEVFGWLILAIVSTVLIIPLPWFFTAFCRWFARNLSFQDGATAEFQGHTGDVLGWVYLALLAGGFTLGPQVHGGPHIRIFSAQFDLWSWRWQYTDWPWWIGYAIAFAGCLWLFGVLGQWHVIRWCVANTALTTKEQFEFHGTYWELTAWEILNGLAVLTIIGWAWTTSAAYRWAAGNTRSAERALTFHGSGFEVLWRSIAMVLFCIPILTIPWALLWYTRWLVSQFTIGSADAVD